ncbi:hypothetical protein ACO0SA_001696 [Hanseniaspora valbyensis]
MDTSGDMNNNKQSPGTPFSNFLDPDLREHSNNNSSNNLLKLAVRKKKTRPILLQTLTPTKYSTENSNNVETHKNSIQKVQDINGRYQSNIPGVVDLNQQIVFLNQQYEEEGDDDFEVDEAEMQRIEMEDANDDIQLQKENPPTNDPMSVATDPPTILNDPPTSNSAIYNDGNKNIFTPLDSRSPNGIRRQHNPIINLNRDYSYVENESNNNNNKNNKNENKNSQRHIPIQAPIQEEGEDDEEEDEEEEEDYEEDLEAFDDEADKILDEIEYRRLFKSLKNNTNSGSSKTNSKPIPHSKDNINNAVNVIGSYGIPIVEEDDRKIFQTENEKNMDNILKNMGVDLLSFNEKYYNEEEDLDYVFNEDDDEEEEDDDDDEELEEDLVNELENEDDLLWFGHNYLRGNEHNQKSQSRNTNASYDDSHNNKFEERPHPIHDKLKLPNNEGEFNVTLYPIYPAQSKYIPSRLINFLKHEYNQEILKGITLPYLKQMTNKEFINFWFKDKEDDDDEEEEEEEKLDSNGMPVVKYMDKCEFDPHDGVLFILVLDSIDKLNPSKLTNKTYKDSYLNHIKWESQCLGIFNIVPCYEGRSSHICTANFLVNEGIRNKLVGSFLMEKFLYWAPKLGYAMVQFPLIYDTNIAIIKILDKFHFQILGKLPNSGVLLGYSEPVSSTSYYKNLIAEDDQYANILNKTAPDAVNNKNLNSITKTKTIQNYLATTDGQVDDVDSNGEIIRFKLLQRFMLTNKYPFPNMSRADKARLRALRYRYQLDGEGRLYLKGREVISNIFEQKNIVREVHNLKHWQVNKMNRVICKDYYWPSLRKTILKVFSECKICNDSHRRRNVVVNGYNPPITVRALTKNNNSISNTNNTDYANKSNNQTKNLITNDNTNQQIIPLIESHNSKNFVKKNKDKQNVQPAIKRKPGRPKKPEGVVTKPATFRLKNISFSYKDKSDKLKTKAKVKTANLGPSTIKKK